jgi:hypothetical protein
MKYVTTIERMAEKQSIAINFLKENIPIETIARHWADDRTASNFTRSDELEKQAIV